jgi:prepilin-type processing-associated H-X9-DG protein
LLDSSAYFNNIVNFVNVQEDFMKFLNTVLAVITVVCFSFSAQAGDKKDDRKLFDKVSSKLEKGGSYFNFQSNKYLFRAVEYTYLQIPEVIKTIVPDQQQQMMPLMIYNCLKPVVKSLGIDEILAAGASSILISEKTDKNPALFRSRQFIYHGDKKVKGLIWDFAAGNNHELSSLVSLPKETLFACTSQSAPGQAWNKIKLIISTIPLPTIQGLPMIAEQSFFNKFNVKLPDFLDSLSGTCSSILMSAKDKDGKPALYAMLKIPNKNNLVFKVLSEIAKPQPYLQVLPDEIIPTKPPALSWLKPVIRRDDKNVYIVSNAKILDIVKKTAAKKDGLITTPEFKYLSQGIQKNGIAFFYFNSNTIKLVIDTVKANAPTGDKDWSVLAKLVPPSDFFLVVSKEKDGVMGTMNSPMDIPLLITYSSVMPSIVQVVKLLPMLNKSRTKKRRINCANNLKQIGLAMKMYAMDHKDKYPSGNNAAGLNKLIKEDYLTNLSIYVCPNSKTIKATTKDLKEANSSYIYIGDFIEGDGANIPVVFDKLDSRKRIINILYQDGHVGALPNKFGNCKELIKYLAKTSSFKPAILKKLQEKAKQIDKELGYK